MHPSVLEWVTDLVTGLDLTGKHILEIGSYNENGTVRPLFDRAESYIGVDVREGPGVDRVVTETHLPFPHDAFDIVVSTEMLEHDLRPWQTVASIYRVLVSGGTLILTARGYDERGCYPIHDYRDCWRFSPAGMTELLEEAGFDQVKVISDPTDPGVFAQGVKL